jgi:23S rRNA (uracil1939-C5)-methyltransferase
VGRPRQPHVGPPIEVTIESLDDQARGVARVDGKVVFVTGALPGERVLARYTRHRGRYDEAKTTQVLDACDDRVVPPCAHFGDCGGCGLQHLAHPAQIAHKQTRLLDNLSRLAGVVPGTVVEPIVGPTWGYRARARLGVEQRKGRGNTILGFRERGSHKVAAVDACAVLDTRVGPHLESLCEALAALPGSVGMKELDLALGDSAGIMAVAMTAEPGADELSLLNQWCDDHHLTLSLESSRRVDREPLLRYRLPEFDLFLEFSSGDFTQVNTDVNQQLVSQAVRLAQLSSDHRVLDLFCGIGNFSLPIARRSAHVVGIEGNGGAVVRASNNALRNDVQNAEFHQSDLSHSKNLRSWFRQRWDCLLLDPPRAGAAAVIEALPKHPPPRIVYVSCSPASLARDVRVAVQRHGYTLTHTGVVDMFPHTDQVESISVLTL